jgi:hypothetical protein
MGRPKLTDAERKEAAARKAVKQNERRKIARVAKGGENKVGVDSIYPCPEIDNEANYSIQDLLNRMDVVKATNVRTALAKYRAGKRS